MHKLPFAPAQDDVAQNLLNQSEVRVVLWDKRIHVVNIPTTLESVVSCYFFQDLDFFLPLKTGNCWLIAANGSYLKWLKKKRYLEDNLLMFAPLSNWPKGKTKPVS